MPTPQAKITNRFGQQVYNGAPSNAIFLMAVLKWVSGKILQIN
mgnify:CR=1 FL=1